MVVDSADADVLGDEPIWHAGQVVGWATSGGYGHCVNRSLAQGYVPCALSNHHGVGAFEIEILGERRPATIIPEPLFDPQGARMRM
jgi:dimethylglycine dehydrogenase